MLVQIPVQLLMHICGEQLVVLLQVPRMQRQNGVAVRDGLLVNDYSMCKCILAQIVGSKKPLELSFCLTLPLAVVPEFDRNSGPRICRLAVRLGSGANGDHGQDQSSCKQYPETYSSTTSQANASSSYHNHHSFHAIDNAHSSFPNLLHDMAMTKNLADHRAFPPRHMLGCILDLRQ